MKYNGNGNAPAESPPVPGTAEAAAWLAGWQRAQGFTDDAAARALGLSVSAFRRQKTGRSGVTEQTLRLAHYQTLHAKRWLDIAQAAMILARIATAVAGYTACAPMGCERGRGDEASAKRGSGQRICFA